MAGGEEDRKRKRFWHAPMVATATETGEALPVALSMPLDAGDVDAVLQQTAVVNQLAVATDTERGEAFARSVPLDVSDLDAVLQQPALANQLLVIDPQRAPMVATATATERGEALPTKGSMPLDVSNVGTVLERAAGANQLVGAASACSDNNHHLTDPPLVTRTHRDATGETDDDRLEQDYNLVFTPYEKNIDIWRQLWRVLKRSDLLVMVVDARDPLFYRCPDLEAYAKEIGEHKRAMLLVNKADLLPLNIRKRWADYFKAHDILYVFWSAKAATAILEGKKLSGYSEEESASLDLDTKIYGRDELLMKLQAEAESVVAQRRTSTSVDDQEASSSDYVSSVAKHVVVGFVGYPNVGKGSTINALIGEKRTGVTHTPGKTKHFQTLIISEELTLCDCPGLVFPSFSSSRGEMVACGVLPITRMTNYREAIQVVADRVPRDILEQIYKITLPKPKPYEPQSRLPTAAELLWAYCSSRGLVSQAGLLDESKAAQQILKDYMDGKIPHYELPPCVTYSKADWEQISCSPTTSANEMGTHRHKFSFPRFDETCQKLPTPSWKNIDTCFDTWKQLWKVLKSCDFLLLVVDARDPLLSRCPDLEAYAKEMDEHKGTMLLVNKADLLPLNIRKRWADYFKANDILYVFWSAKAATATLEGKTLSGYSEEESASLDLDTKIYGRDELLMKLQAEAESIVAQRRTSTSVDDQEASSSDSVSSVAKHVVVGFVGYPSVGKSSTINALVGDEKATGVSHTSGKIKLVLYDCPGHILPSFSASSYGLLLEEGISFEQLAIHNLCLAVNALLAAVECQISRGKVNDGLGWMIRRLKVLAEDIRVWLQSNCEVKVLIDLHLKVGKGIAWFIDENERGMTEVKKLLKDMICDFETINANLESKKNLSRKINGEWVKLFKACYLQDFITVNLWIVKHLELILAKLSLWKGDSSPSLLDNVKWLKVEIQAYKVELNMMVKGLKGPREIPPDVFILVPKTRGITDCFNMIENSSYFKRECAPTDVNLRTLSSAEKKLHKTLWESRRQGTLKFVRIINPSFKGKETIVSDEVDLKCMCCFENAAFYFNTCCDLIMCRLCAAKRCLFCKQPHTPGENLLFPVIVRRPVLPPNPLQGGES